MKMAHNFIISFLLYYLLVLFQNPHTTAASIRDSLKKDSDILSNCDQLEKRSKRIINDEPKSKYLKNLSEIYFKFLCRRNPNAVDYSLLKGWGARGMPFNVLYTPNVHQQRIMKSTPKKQEKLKFKKEPKRMPEIYDLVLEDEKHSPKNLENTLKKQMTPRKYYSLIPQLFVSYGW